MTTGERIKEARKMANMTQAELAEKMGIPYQSIGQWERDIRNPKIETLQRIAEALNCSLAFLSLDTDNGKKIQKELIANNDLTGLDEFFGREPGTFEGIEKIGEKVSSVGGKTIKTTKYRFKVKGYNGNAYFEDREAIEDAQQSQSRQENLPVVFDTSKIVDALNVTLEREKRKDRYIKAFDMLNDVGQKIAVDRVEELTEIRKYQLHHDPSEE